LGLASQTKRCAERDIARYLLRRCLQSNMLPACRLM
jgi:hypothetical protein